MSTFTSQTTDSKLQPDISVFVSVVALYEYKQFDPGSGFTQNR